MLSLPSMPAPALRRLAVTVLSYGGLKPLRMWLPAVVSTPLVANRSLMPSGMPASDGSSPEPRAARASGLDGRRCVGGGERVVSASRR